MIHSPAKKVPNFDRHFNHAKNTCFNHPFLCCLWFCICIRFQPKWLEIGLERWILIFLGIQIKPELIRGSMEVLNHEKRIWFFEGNQDTLHESCEKTNHHPPRSWNRRVLPEVGRADRYSLPKPNEYVPTWLCSITTKTHFQMGLTNQLVVSKKSTKSL